MMMFWGKYHSCFSYCTRVAVLKMMNIIIVLNRERICKPWGLSKLQMGQHNLDGMNMNLDMVHSIQLQLTEVYFAAVSTSYMVLCFN